MNCHFQHTIILLKIDHGIYRGDINFTNWLFVNIAFYFSTTSSLEWPVPSQMFVMADYMARCLILYSRDEATKNTWNERLSCGTVFFSMYCIFPYYVYLLLLCTGSRLMGKIIPPLPILIEIYIKYLFQVTLLASFMFELNNYHRQYFII